MRVRAPLRDRDGCQLPPTVTEKRAAEQGLGLSLFSRLQALGVAPLLLAHQYAACHPSSTACGTVFASTTT